MKKFFSRLSAAALVLALLCTPAFALTPQQAGELLNLYYVDEVPQRVLEQTTVESMLAELGDPYTQYFDADTYQLFLDSMRDANLTGIGVSMQMEAEMTELLPLKREDFSNIVIPADIIQEEIQMVPSPSAVMDHVVPNYVTGFIFGALVESFCSEQNARMMAMQSASDNANAILNDLSIEYNRVRQAAITQEITEVISGAKAQKKKQS